MYTRLSPSRQIALEVLDKAAQYGHVRQECGYKQVILSYLDEHGTAETLGGWVDTVRDYRHPPSEWTMAFIWCHDYLRAMFPADVLDDFLRLAMRMPQANLLISYVAGPFAQLPADVEAKRLRSDEVFAAYDQKHFAELVGTV